MNAFSSTASRAMRVLSPRIEPPDRADDGSTASTATFEPAAVSVDAQLVDEGRLADPGHPADPDPARSPGVRQQLDQQLLRPLAVVTAPRLDQGDGARHHPPVPGQHTLDERRDVDLPSPDPEAMQSTVSGRATDSARSRSCAASPMTVPGRKTAAAPISSSVGTSSGGMTPPTTIITSSAPRSASACLQRRHQREVAGGQRRDADDVHVGLDRLPGDLLRRLEQRADVDVEAEVGERGGDDLLAAVVAVLAHLGDQDPRAAALGLLELPRPSGGSRPRVRSSLPRRGTHRRWCAPGRRAARRPPPARRRSPRRSPSRGRRRRRASAGWSRGARPAVPRPPRGPRR